MIIDFPKGDPENIAIGRRIRVWRLTRGLSQEALADRIGVSHDLMTRAEMGLVRLTGAQLYAVTMQLSIPMRLLFEDAQPRKPLPAPRGRASNDP